MVNRILKVYFFVPCSVLLFTYREGQGNVVSVHAMKAYGGEEV